jgi:hypothetical protein
VLIGVELERQYVIGPARERARSLANVMLGIAAHAHREQLEQLAAEVLVGVLLHVLAVIEIHEHRGILQDPDQQSAETA